MILREDIKLRIDNKVYYLISWSRFPKEKRSAYFGSSTMALSACARNWSCVHTLRDVLRETSHGYNGSIPDEQVIKDFKKILDEPMPSVYMVEKEFLKVKCTNQRVLDWINRAIHSGSDPYSYLSKARNVDHLDEFDDNLSAAERYFEGYDGNYNQHLIAGSAALKGLREVEIFWQKPFETLLGRNGSSAIEFVTRWGMLGAFDRENGITASQRVQRGV